MKDVRYNKGFTLGCHIEPFQGKVSTKNTFYQHYSQFHALKSCF